MMYVRMVFGHDFNVKSQEIQQNLTRNCRSNWYLDRFSKRFNGKKDDIFSRHKQPEAVR